MKKTKASFAGLFLVLSVLTTPVFPQEKAGNSDIVSGNNAFALNLYATLKNEKGNIFFSPYSISTALAMAYAGAAGNTESQMAHALHFHLNQATFHPAFGELQARINEIQKKGTVQLSVANSLWMQRDYKFLPQFLELTDKNYRAGLNYVDYKTAAEKARTDINTWVERKTRDKIKDLVAPGMLNAQTKMVLANAIYFKGSWGEKFDSSLTRDAAFFVTPRDSIKAKMMTMRKHEFGYMENDTVQCCELPYAGNDLSMVVILPKKRDGISVVEKLLSADAIGSWIGQIHKEEINIFIPKFKTTKEFLLNQPLSALGMKDAFGSDADFSKMTGNKDLVISAVIHKAFVEVNEEGTVAAAATAVMMKAFSTMVDHTVEFRADHPFVFLIREISSGSILFLGKIVNPVM
jgi:serine protease inhibitor